MRKIRATACALMLALAQPLPAGAQSQPPAPPGGLTQGNIYMGGRDACAPFVADKAHPFVTQMPPAEWRGKSAELHAVIGPKGVLEELTLARASGSATLDAAAMAHVKDDWHWANPACGRRGVTFSIGLPRMNCDAVPLFTPVLNVAVSDKTLLTALPDWREAARITTRIRLVVDLDGHVIAATIVEGSGNALRDAALLAHVKANWRYYALADDCRPASVLVRIGFPHVSCAPAPLTETQTSPENVDIQDRPRSVDLKVGVIPDGSVAIASVMRSSGDAGLDAAAMAHVRDTWRWHPYACIESGNAISMVMGEATVSFAYMVPDPPPR